MDLSVWMRRHRHDEKKKASTPKKSLTPTRVIHKKEMRPKQKSVKGILRKSETPKKKSKNVSFATYICRERE